MPFDPWGAYIPPKPRKTKYAPYGAPVGTSSGSPNEWLPPGPDPAPVPEFRPINYADLIDNDPTFVALKAALSGQGIADAAQRDAAMRRAFVQFGSVPDMSALGFDTSGIIDEQTRALAAQSTASGLSTTARLGEAHSDAVNQIKRALAARGAGRSGESGYRLGREDKAFTTANYDASQKLLDYIGGVQAGFAESERRRKEQLIAGSGDAASRQASYPWNTPTDRPVMPPGGTVPAAPAGPAYTLPSGSITMIPRKKRSSGAWIGGRSSRG